MHFVRYPVVFVIWVIALSSWGRDDVIYDLELRIDPDPSDVSRTSIRKTSQFQAVFDQALDQIQKGTSVKIVLGGGVYRDAICLEKSPNLVNAPLAIVAEADAAVSIRGSVIWNGWRIEGSNAFEHSLESTPLTLNGEIQGLADFLRRPHQVFVEGVRLHPRGSLNALEVATFFVSDKDRRLFFIPPANGQVRDNAVEVSYGNSALCSIRGVHELTIRGIVFEQGSLAPKGARPFAVQFEGCDDLRIQNLDISYNGGGGLSIHESTNVTVTSGKIERNGLWGMEIRSCSDVKVNGTSVELNGSLLYGLGDKGDWQEAGAISIFNCSYAEFKGVRSVENRMGGLLFSKVDGEMNLNRFFSAANEGHGLIVEYSEGVEVKGGQIGSNQGNGVLLRASRFNLQRSVVYGNVTGQIIANEISDANALICEKNIISTHLEEGPLVAVSPIDEQWDVYVGKKNLFYHANEVSAFRWFGRAFSLSDWRLITAQDLGSFWGDALMIDPDEFDFMPKPQSPWFKQSKWPVIELESKAIAAARATHFSD